MNLSNVMPFHIGITIFLGFFSGSLGIYAARAIARCLHDLYDAASRVPGDNKPEQEFE